MIQILVGDYVFKPSGHEFIGIVVAVFWTLSNERRVVVESTTPGAKKLLFIFRPDQLANQSTGEMFDG